MVALDFPSAPSNGDTYAGYTYNSTVGAWQWDVANPSVVNLTDTTITTPTAGDFLVYDGTAWVNEVPSGSIVDVKQVLKTDTFSASLATGASTTVTGLSITHTMQNASNKLLLTMNIGSVANSGGNNLGHFWIEDDGTPIGIGDAAGSRIRISAGTYLFAGTTADYIGQQVTHNVLHSPGDTASHTYTVEIANSTVAQTIYVNRTEADTDNIYQARAVSSITLMEIAG